jgi:hypothetical protein
MMTDDFDKKPAQDFWRRLLPSLTSRRWTALLGLSLMGNLLVGGWLLGNRFHRGGERMMGAGLVQLVPRDFLSELPRDRRRELLGDVRTRMRDLRQGLPDDVQITRLADAIGAETYSARDAQAAIEDISTGPNSMAGRSAALTVQMLEKLTPEERKLLANAIRQRNERRKKKP